MAKPDQYRRSQVALHWVMFILFAIALIAIGYRETVPKDGGQALRDTLRAIHITAGLSVFVLAFFRLGIRLTAGVPPILGESRLQRLAAEAMHWALYAVMFALPITGIVFSQAGGRTVAFLGLALPQMIAPDPALRSVVREIHEFLGGSVYILVGLHAAGALWHHFVVKDDTLRRMKPGCCCAKR